VGRKKERKKGKERERERKGRRSNVLDPILYLVHYDQILVGLVRGLA